MDASEALIFALVRGQSFLHAALYEATENYGPLREQVRLVSDPVANQSLRLSDAADAVMADADRLTFSIGPGNVHAFLQRFSLEEAAQAARPLHMASRSAVLLGEAAKSALRVLNTFPESTELELMSRARAELASASEAQRVLQWELYPVSGLPDWARIVQSHQHRAIDIAMMQPSGWLFLGSDTVLEAGARYRIRVHAGSPGPGSLLRDPPPSVDPLLPDPPGASGHRLEFVVFGHDFTVLSETRQVRYLPLLGGTQPAYFDVRTPALDEDCDSSLPGRPCRARIAVYYEGNLIQSFLLHAFVDSQERRLAPMTLHAELEFSQSSRLSNLDEIGRRPFSIAANESPGATHWLMLKGKDLDGDVQLTEAQLQGRIDTFRKTLLEATFSNPEEAKERFELGQPRNWGEFDAYVRRLARDGALLFERIFYSAPAKLRPLLAGIGESHDQLVQVTLHNSSFSFPWTAVYDRTPPDDDEPVCLGGVSREEIEAGEPLEFRCGHDYRSQAFCVYGFWGVRQHFEYLLPGAGDPVRTLAPSGAGGRICLALGNLNPYTQPLVDKLKEELGEDSIRLLGDENPLDVLWSDARPAEIVVLGHLDIPAASPNDPRIVFLGKKQALRHSDVFGRLVKQEWDDPNSLVLLMACGTAATDLRSLVSLLEAFAAAPASAVVGTETPVVSSLVSYFAAELSLAMWRDHVKLGEAMTRVRRRLLEAANPLGFGFSAYGNAELEIAA